MFTFLTFLPLLLPVALTFSTGCEGNNTKALQTREIPNCWFTKFKHLNFKNSYLLFICGTVSYFCNRAEAIAFSECAFPECGTNLPHPKLDKHRGRGRWLHHSGQPHPHTRTHLCTVKTPWGILMRPYFFLTGSPPTNFSRRVKMDTKTLGDYRSLLQWVLCPLVTRCNFVKAIKLNKYNFNISRVIDKLAALVVLFLRKKKKRYT